MASTTPTIFKCSLTVHKLKFYQPNDNRRTLTTIIKISMVFLALSGLIVSKIVSQFSDKSLQQERSPRCLNGQMMAGLCNKRHFLKNLISQSKFFIEHQILANI